MHDACENFQFHLDLSTYRVTFVGPNLIMRLFLDRVANKKSQ